MIAQTQEKSAKTLREIIIDIIAKRTGAVSYSEIAGVIQANYSRNDGKPIKPRFIQQVIRGMVDDQTLVYDTVKNAKSPNRYYRVAGNPARPMTNNVLLSENPPVISQPKKPAPPPVAVDPDEWQRDLNIPKSKLKPIAGRKQLEAYLAQRELEKAMKEVWA
ncbi:MAG: hypothetical protein E6Q83_03655 [Thiothrix sp.]|nr:MAG: hypothetical protein E6Q83_03655 [Thiothrix sp.]